MGPQPLPPRPMSTSPPPYTDNDIYGRIGMTRNVQVGGTLPAGFGRHQMGYSSLPPQRRQSFVPTQGQQRQPVSRRSSVASYTAGMETKDGRRPAASNPSTPEKLLDKKEKKKDKKKKKKKKGKKKKKKKKK